MHQQTLCTTTTSRSGQLTCGGAHAQQLAALDGKALPHGPTLAVQGDRCLSTAHRHH